MATLYQVAAANSGLVVGTGNKVEDFGVGFYTKYGDGGEIFLQLLIVQKLKFGNLEKF